MKLKYSPRPQINLPWLSTIVALVVLASCSTAVEDTPTTTAIPLTIKTPTLRNMPTKLDIPTPLSISPTPRVFEMRRECEKANGMGHILFLQHDTRNGDNPSTNFNLLAMDGNGCFPRFLMNKVSGSPAWSKDGNQIAIGCENNGYLCILDAKTTLNSCDGSAVEVGTCRPKIKDKYALPSMISGENILRNISFSTDGSQIAVEGYQFETDEYFVFILTVADGTWESLAERGWGFDVDFSPVDNRLAISGISIINIDNGITANDLAIGIDPRWSPDGKHIAFIKDSGRSDKEPFGIALLDFSTNEWSWLYAPANRDLYYWPPQNIILHGDFISKSFSWSQNGRFIAFASSYRHSYDSQIFRLDIDTGGIVILTDDLLPKADSHAFYSPVWEP